MVSIMSQGFYVILYIWINFPLSLALTAILSSFVSQVTAYHWRKPELELRVVIGILSQETEVDIYSHILSIQMTGRETGRAWSIIRDNQTCLFLTDKKEKGKKKQV